MEECLTFQDYLPLLAMGDLPTDLSEQVERHVQACAPCQKELEAYAKTFQALKTLPDRDPGDLFFKTQEQEIISQIQEEAEFLGYTDLISDLRAIPLSEPHESFFEQQAANIFQGLKNETQAEDFEEIIAELKEIPIQDPGDLFFHRQRKKIEQQLKLTADAKTPSKKWVKTFAVAASFLLVIGLSRIVQKRTNVLDPFSDSIEMLDQFSAKELNFEVPEFDELNSMQLDLLAQRLEGRLIEEVGDVLVEPNVELEDLSDQELDQLIQRLEAKVTTS